MDYKEMYNILFNKITDIIEELQQVQKKTEEIYINSDHELILLEGKKPDQPGQK